MVFFSGVTFGLKQGQIVDHYSVNVPLMSTMNGLNGNASAKLIVKAVSLVVKCPSFVNL